MYKGIFWCYLTCFDDDMFGVTVLPVKVKCNLSGSALEEAEFSSKSGDNFKGLPIAIRRQVPGHEAAHGRRRSRPDRYHSRTAPLRSLRLI